MALVVKSGMYSLVLGGSGSVRITFYLLLLMINAIVTYCCAPHACCLLKAPLG
jgi:hypothetical protein